MRILILIVVILILIAFLIYKINKTFGKKELLILITVIVVFTTIGIFTSKSSEEKVPQIFKEKYQKERNIEILKLSYERLNNKNISSSINFIYDFSYIIKKDGKEYVCNAKPIKIKKIEDEYIFENFDKLNEQCNEK